MGNCDLKVIGKTAFNAEFLTVANTLLYVLRKLIIIKFTSGFPIEFGVGGILKGVGGNVVPNVPFAWGGDPRAFLCEKSENFPKISLLKVENFQFQNLFPRPITFYKIFFLPKIFLSGNGP